MTPHTRLAVIADVHGNADALAAVLYDISQHAPDALLNLGDCFSGPLDVARTADLLDASNIAVTVRGNHDRCLLNPAAMDHWDRAALPHLSAETLSWLALLPPTAVIADAFCCHATPQDDVSLWLEQIGPDATLHRAPLPQIRARAEAVPQSLILCGHTHKPRALTLPDGRMIVNPGSVGCPGFYDDDPAGSFHVSTGTPHAAYAVLDHGPQGWTVAHRLIPYDRRDALARARTAGFSDWVRALTDGWANPA